MYKFVYTTMTSHEYYLLSWALEAREKANNNKPKNEFKDHDESEENTNTIHMVIFNPILITL
jgi:hypothetical protein